MKEKIRQRRMAMRDVLTPDQRFRSMSHNRGRTKPERKLASELWRRGLRYYTSAGYKAVSGRRLPGSPDLIFPRQRLALFVDGCFWHGCSSCKGVPGQSGEYWKAKIEENIARDSRVDGELEAAGWIVIRIWEHELQNPDGVGMKAGLISGVVRDTCLTP